MNFFVSQVDAWVEDTVYFSSGGELYNGHGWALVYQNSRYVTHLTWKSVISNCKVNVTLDCASGKDSAHNPHEVMSCS